MSLLGEAALLPSVLEAGDVHGEELEQLIRLESAMHDYLLVRDLAGGAWSQALAGRASKRAEVVLLFLATHGRLTRVSDAVNVDTTAWSPAEWLAHVRQTANAEPKLDAVIRRDANGPACMENETQLRAFHEGPWFERRRGLGAIPREMSAFSALFGPFLRFAKVVHIADPGFDPSQVDYAHWPDLLQQATASRHSRLRLTVHRPCFELAGGRSMVKGAEWETRFAAFAKLDPRVVATQVRIWPEVHLRGLYSNLGGFLAENGFALDKRRALAVSWQNERQAHAALHSNLKDYRQQHVFTLPPSEAKSFPQNDLGRQ